MSHSFPIPENEEKRVAALKRYGLLDTPPEQIFDDMAYLASYICDTPMASVTLVDETRQWFKARVGIVSSETPREQAFCAHTILADTMLVVEDATQDQRFVNNPLVTAAPNIRFYAGAPLIDKEGFALGSICVIDRTPRKLAEGQEKALKALARQVVSQIEFRQVSAELASVLGEVKTLAGLLPICSYCKNIRNDEGYWHRVEQYIGSHTDAKFSHGICPDCLKEHHPEVHASMEAKKKQGGE